MENRENLPDHEPVPVTDEHARGAAFERHQALAAGVLALPNLFLRSALTLGLLYGMLGLVLVALVETRFLNVTLAVGIGCGLILLQYALGPWLMDLSLRFLYTMRWAQPDELPEHVEAFVRRVCDEQGMKFPSFGIINDGAPQAFTYGHHPSNARVVISRGVLELLEPGEVEAVVAHELGHAHNWDMALMTLANLVPLLLYFLYRVAIQFRFGDNDKGKLPAWAVAAGAYLLYIISEYVVLWFSRTREYYADRFSGRMTGDPNALARALVKIAYGLAAQDSKQHAAEEANKAASKNKKEKAVPALAGAGALGALNIFDRGSALNLVVSSGGQSSEPGAPAALDPERVKGAMQWDLWNPWARFYELNSTHPLVAKRLQYLGDQAAAQGQEPFVVFDRARPESYWDDFAVDLVVVLLPVLGLLAGAGVFVALGLTGRWQPLWLGVAVALAGVGSLIKTRFAYRGWPFEHRTVASLVAHVKVSPVRPVPAVVTGTIIGKGVPGLIYSDSFVIRDPTGILFLDYRQPLPLWGFLFGLLRAGRYQGQEVRVTGWFRRAPVPYLEMYHLETVDGSLPARRCYTYHARLALGAILAVAGIALAVVLAAV
jgi:Zn-dependent protease with chaperone function